MSLADYAGKTVKIAFRYRNIGDGWAGNSMAIDAVTVTRPQPEAYYQLPYGTLLVGMTNELTVASTSNCLMPAWTPVTWTAESNSTTEQNEWTVYDAQTEGSNILNGNTVNIEYGYSNGEAYPYPLLTAKAGDLTHAYSYDVADEKAGGIYYGGHVPDMKFEGFPDETVLVGNYDYKHKRLTTPYLDTDAYCFGTAPANVWGTGVTQTAFGNFFPAPAATFTIENVYVTLGECDMDADAELTLSIYEVDEYGQLAETPAATATVKGSDITGFGFYQAKFILGAPYAMKGNTLMMVSGFANNDKIRKVAACAQALRNDANHNYAYMMFDMNGQTALYSASQALEDYSSALYFSLDGSFHFLRPEQEIVDLDLASNQVTINFTASSTPDKWWIVDGENTLPIGAEGTAHKWLTVTPAAEGNALNFAAEPAEADRAVTVVLANGGDQARVRIRQKGNSGVEAVAAADQGVSLNGDILTVAGAGSDILTVYSADGRIVARGANGLDISGIAQGIYVVRAGRTSYKFVK